MIGIISAAAGIPAAGKDSSVSFMQSREISFIGDYYALISKG